MMRHLLICSQWVLDRVVLVVDALVRFNKIVFVGLIFMGPTIGALVSTLLVLMVLMSNFLSHISSFYSISFPLMFQLHSCLIWKQI